MSSRSLSRRLSGTNLCLRDVPQLPPRKRPGYWLSTPAKPSVNSANESSIHQVSSAAVTTVGALSVRDPGAVSDQTIRKKRRCVLQLEDHVEEDRVTRDLCCSFQNVEFSESRQVDVVPWKNISNTLITAGMDLPQSGTTSEEDLLIGDRNDSNTADTVRSAAELLTQLTCGRKVDSNGQSPDVTSCTPHSRNARQGLELPIRWGVKKKVSYESRRSMDSCDLGLCTGMIRNFSFEDVDKTSAKSPVHAPTQTIETTFHTSRQSFHRAAKMKWDQPSPSRPGASLEFYRVPGSSKEAGTSSSRLQLAEETAQGSTENQCKALATSRTCPGNILKLPREMQGRWSSERYKSAQLKLVDIMHARKAVPGRPVLRPVLREEARKHIGDTGLLDHLLKHMTDTIVNTGDRFRRRHNSEGAMEYWLEHASLMDLRKAAGVEDPSWIPPPGWKPGDTLPDRNWHLNFGLTSSEAAEMKKLKETVERLRSEMKILCGSIKVSNQRGVLSPSLSVNHQKPFEEDAPARAENESDLTQGIRKDMIQFKTEMVNMEQQFHQEHKSGTPVSLGIRVDAFQKAESEVLQMQETCTSRTEISVTTSNRVDLEGQLQDVCKAVATIQAEVSDTIKMLGIVPPIKTMPMRHPLDPSTPGYPDVLFTLSRGNISSTTYAVSPEFLPTGSPDPVLHEFVTPNLDAPMRHCSSLKDSMNQCSYGGTVASNGCPYTDRFSQALSNYDLVDQSGLYPARSLIEGERKDSAGITMSGAVHEGVPPVALQQRRSPNFKPIFTCQPTGFRLCRPPGSFLWPSKMNYTAVLPTDHDSSMTRQDPTVKLRGPEDGSGDNSTRQVLEMSNSTSTIASVHQEDFSTRSIAESQVAAAMANMSGCMATAPNFSVPTLPLRTNEIDSSVDGMAGTTAKNLGHCSAPKGQSESSALSLSLSLSLSPRSLHHNDAFKISM